LLILDFLVQGADVIDLVPRGVLGANPLEVIHAEHIPCHDGPNAQSKSIKFSDNWENKS
jgi:hypothetical protein